MLATLNTVPRPVKSRSAQPRLVATATIILLFHRFPHFTQPPIRILAEIGFPCSDLLPSVRQFALLPMVYGS